jgi:hypothetical protein
VVGSVYEWIEGALGTDRVAAGLDIGISDQARVLAVTKGGGDVKLWRDETSLYQAHVASAVGVLLLATATSRWLLVGLLRGCLPHGSWSSDSICQLA